MNWVHLSKDQRQAYIEWVKIFKKFKSDIDLFEIWIKKDLINVQEFIPKEISFKFNKRLFESKDLVVAALNDSDQQIATSALYYLIWYPDKYFIPILEGINFTDKSQEDFKENILILLNELKGDELNSKHKTSKEKENPKPYSPTTEKPICHPTIEIFIGPKLINFIKNTDGDNVLERIKDLRKQFARTLGIVVPPVRIRDNPNINDNQYQILIKGNVISEFELFPSSNMLMNTDKIKENFEGQETIEPTFNFPSKWISKDDSKTAIKMGFFVVGAEMVLTTHLSEVIKKYSYELLTRQYVKTIIDDLQITNPVLIEGIIPEKLSIPKVHRILQGLLKENIPILDHITIFEVMGDYQEGDLSNAELINKIKTELTKFQIKK